MSRDGKQRADWEAIEREFRAGQLSIRAIAAAHGVTDTAIRKKAKAEGWRRGLADKVRKKVRNNGSQSKREPDGESVESAAYSTFANEVADVICARIANGESLRTICNDDAMPAQSTVFKWLNEDEGFSEQYARAREAQADALFDEILHISNTPLLGEKTKTDKAGKVETTTGDMIEHRRLQIETRKWMAGKLKPKKYGDKLDLNVSGSLETASEEQIDARITQLLGKAGANATAGGAGTPEEAE